MASGPISVLCLLVMSPLTLIGQSSTVQDLLEVLLGSSPLKASGRVVGNP